MQFLRTRKSFPQLLSEDQLLAFLQPPLFVSAAFILQVVLKPGGRGGGSSDLVKLKVADFKVDLHSTGLHPWRAV